MNLGVAMHRVVVLGRGGAGKSTLAAQLERLTALPVIELDAHFWSPELAPLPPGEWATRQRRLVADPRWILDGDLGPYDAPEIRLQAADTVLVLDFPLWRCAWRTGRRGREKLDFWRWILGYRRRYLPRTKAAIAANAPGAEVHFLRSPRDVERFLAAVRDSGHRDSR
ncbi:adenylate kinase [Mycobacterium talmoniae]|nr:adenylate kinase [Mycobacterium talmoniae]